MRVSFFQVETTVRTTLACEKLNGHFPASLPPLPKLIALGVSQLAHATWWIRCSDGANEMEPHWQEQLEPL